MQHLKSKRERVQWKRVTQANNLQLPHLRSGSCLSLWMVWRKEVMKVNFKPWTRIIFAVIDVHTVLRCRAKGFSRCGRVAKRSTKILVQLSKLKVTQLISFILTENLISTNCSVSTVETWYPHFYPAQDSWKTTNVSSFDHIADLDFQGKKSEPKWNWKTVLTALCTYFALILNAEVQILQKFPFKTCG